MLLGAMAVALGGFAARNLTGLEIAFHDLVTALPDAFLDTMRLLNGAGALISVLVVLAASIAARRIRFIGGVVVAAGLSAAHRRCGPSRWSTLPRPWPRPPPSTAPSPTTRTFASASSPPSSSSPPLS